MRRISFLLVFITALAGPVWGDSITVSAAISLKESMTQIAADYHVKSGDDLTLNFGASGQLAAQISQGAPVDVFVSAGEKEMDQLAAQNMIDAATRTDVCGNELVLIVPLDAAFVPASFSDLTDGHIKKVAIGQPKSVPAGQYAQEVLDTLKISDVLKPKLVFGENVRQVLDYVIRGEVEAGVVYSTDAATAGSKIRIAAKSDASQHDPILYPAAVIRQTSKAEAARHFLDYLSSDAAGKVLAAHGFVVGNEIESLPASVHLSGVGLTASDWTAERLMAKLAAEIKPVQYNSRGTVHTFSCVPLASVLAAAGAPADFAMGGGAAPTVKNPQMRQVVVVTGRDGYRVVFSLAEILPMVGGRTVWAALAEDGKPLSDSDGPVRLIVPDDKMPSRAVHEIGSIEIVDLSAPATKASDH